MCSSPRPVLGPEPIHRRSLLILVSEDGDRPQSAGGLDQAVTVGLRLEVILRSVMGSSVSAASSAMTSAGSRGAC